MNFPPRTSLGRILMRRYILRMKSTFRMEFSCLAAEGAVKPTLSVLTAAGAEGLGVLCCARLAAVTTH